MKRYYDFFLTHAWRYHDDWRRLVEQLDACPGLAWRNFSVPWYDPALDPRTDTGGRIIRRTLEGQIRPARVVILLAGVFEAPSARKWVDLELALAREYEKPILALPRWGEASCPESIVAVADGTASWDIRSLLAAADSANQSREKFPLAAR